MTAPRIWIVSLNYLDDGTADFKHIDPSGGPSTAEFALPRSEWEAMGHPSQLAITVQTEATR